MIRISLALAAILVVSAAFGQQFTVANKVPAKVIVVNKMPTLPRVPPPPVKGPCSTACTCGCVSTGVCTCNRPTASQPTPQSSQSLSSVPGMSAPGGCYINSAGQKVCPLNRRP